MGQCVCVAGTPALSLHQSSTEQTGATSPVLEKAFSPTQRCSFLFSHSSHSPFPSLSESGWFQCPACNNRPPWSPLSHGHVIPAARTPLLSLSREEQRILLGTPGPGCGEASQLAEVPSSLEPTMLLCPGGRNAAVSLGCLVQGEAGRAVRNTNTAFRDPRVQPAVAERQLGEERICTEQSNVVRQQL